MDDERGVGRGYRRVSPWPLFVALGLVVGELGIFLGLLPLAVGGVLLFGGSVAGAIAEAGYVASPWRLLAAMGALFVLLGVVVWAWRVPGLAPGRAIAALATDAVARRGAAIVGGGVGLLVVAVVGAVWTPDAGWA